MSPSQRPLCCVAKRGGQYLRTNTERLRRRIVRVVSINKLDWKWVLTVFSHIKLLGDLAVAHALGNPFKDLKLAARDAELLLFLFVRDEGFPGRDRNLLHNDRVLRSCQLEAEPDPNSGKDRRGQSSVDFDRMFDYQEAILSPLEDSNQDSTD